MAKNPLGDLGNNLGEYLRDQRVSASLSVRQLSERAGISNPYLSQIERGLKRPSAEILQQIAKGLSISAETLYVQAGLIDPDDDAPSRPTAREAIAADLQLTGRQRQTLIDIYDSFVGSSPGVTAGEEPADLPSPAPSAARETGAGARSAKQTSAKKTTPKRSATKKSTAPKKTAKRSTTTARAAKNTR